MPRTLQLLRKVSFDFDEALDTYIVCFYLQGMRKLSEHNIRFSLIYVLHFLDTNCYCISELIFDSSK